MGIADIDRQFHPFQVVAASVDRPTGNLIVQASITESNSELLPLANTYWLVIKDLHSCVKYLRLKNNL